MHALLLPRRWPPCRAWRVYSAAGCMRRHRALPSDSIYQLAVPLTDQNGRTFKMDERRGQPVLVSMFYTSCQFVCPMLIDALRDTEAQLSAQERARLSVLMVSFDPAHDTVAVLRSTADGRQLDGNHWTLARTDPASVRSWRQCWVSSTAHCPTATSIHHRAALGRRQRAHHGPDDEAGHCRPGLRQTGTRQRVGPGPLMGSSSARGLVGLHDPARRERTRTVGVHPHVVGNDRRRRVDMIAT
jgi:hypothetical protein